MSRRPLDQDPWSHLEKSPTPGTSGALSSSEENQAPTNDDVHVKERVLVGHLWASHIIVVWVWHRAFRPSHFASTVTKSEMTTWRETNRKSAANMFSHRPDNKRFNRNCFMKYLSRGRGMDHASKDSSLCLLCGWWTASIYDVLFWSN